MSEPIGTAAAANGAVSQNVQTDTPMPTAGADASGPAVPALVTHPVVQAIVQGAQATNPPETWAQTAASIFSNLLQLQPQIFAISRASPKTQAAFGLGEEALALVLAAFFPHPAG